MRKALRFVWLLMALAGPALAAPSGKLLVVRGFNGALDTDVHYSGTLSMRRMESMTCQVLDRLGINYTMVSPTLVRTIDWKEGTFVHNRQPAAAANYGDASQPVESFNAILSLAGLQNLAAAGYGSMTGAGRPDSVMLSRYLKANDLGGPLNGLQVPLCFIVSDAMTQFTSSGIYCGLAPTVACSIGTGGATYNNGTDGFQGFEIPRSRKIFWTAGQFNPVYERTTSGNTVCNRGFRTLISAQQCNYPYYPRTGVTPPVWVDSILTAEQSDTMVAHEVMFTGISPCKHAIFGLVDGPGGADDSTSAANATYSQMPGEGDVSLITYLVCHLDSLANHTLIDWDKMPLELGVTVDAAFCRTANRAGPGILPSDSSVVKATIDSLVALNASGGVQIKITLGVNADSMRSLSNDTPLAGYTSELGWWRNLGGNVRFSPQAWRGTYKPRTSTEGDGVAAATNIVDIFGLRRNRSFYGDGSYADGDTSIAMLLVNSRDHMRGAGIRAEEMSHTLLPVMDDWTPPNKSSGLSFDSLSYVANLLGYSAIRADNRSPAGAVFNSVNGTAATSMTPWGIAGTGALGYTNVAGRYKTTLGTLNVLCHNGYSIAGGGRIMYFAGADSARAVGAALDSASWYEPIYRENTRTWSGLMLNELRNSDFQKNSQWLIPSGGVGYDFNASFSFFNTEGDKRMAIIDGLVSPKAAQIRKFNVADFSGVPGGPPARPGYWTLKSLKNSFDAINQGNGRTVLRFQYPELMRPYEQ